MATEIRELQLLDEDETGVYAISIVDMPAIESNFIALNKKGKHQYSLAKVDEEKRLLVGAALIPNKQILRVDAENNPYYVYFSKRTVKEAAYRFLKSSAHHNHTLQHEKEIEGLYVAESWLVEDKENDKSKKYGLNVPVGTWMVAVKVENDEIWEKEVKEGNVKGFSIEAYFTEKMKTKEIKQSSYWESMMEVVEDLKNKIKEFD